MAGRIPREFIDELLNRVDIVEVIDARVPLKKAGKDFKACCPFHDEKTPSFTVSQTKQFYHCFGCGKNGSAIGFLMEYEHMSFPEAVTELAGRAGLTVPTEAGVAMPDSGSNALLDLLNEAGRFYRQQLRTHPNAGKAVDYLKGRGLSGEIAQDFSLGFAPEGWDNLVKALGKDDPTRDQLVAAGLAAKKEGGGYYDRFRNRVIFPIHDHRGRIVGFGGRVMDPKDEPKYLNSPETSLFHKGRELYGLFRARDAIKKSGRVLVVEGYMDVVALAQHGIDYAVATLGTAATRDHLERLYRHAPEVVFCFDGDRAGREAAWRALEVTLPLLHEGRQASFLFLPEGEDPDTLVRKEGREVFESRQKTARSLPDYLFESLVQKVDLGRLDGRARLVELARPYLSKIAAGALRELMLDRLGELSQVERGKLSTLLRSEGRATADVLAPPAAGYQPASLLWKAAAMLVQDPGLAAQAPDPAELALLDEPGADLFREILGWFRANPGRTTAALLEQYRDHEQEATLGKLAAWRHPGLAEDMADEFSGALDGLRKLAVHGRVAQLTRKAALNEQEQIELARLLKLRNPDKPPLSRD
ncbi:MAG: DNA primase [Candidatus Muproteobacteria bacterium RBG_16_62_13]|uniref:DNA primase n=1 Tax=Candidatus Muproteobacteria bacterium RBG_16_62_13 TaxID=1817756 RepID=A0A1F6T3N9_9PROT|nr:MAG: DNA primase [Candidatus Muproteobacteria bacterium RBG_16_62_13]